MRLPDLFHAGSLSGKSSAYQLDLAGAFLLLLYVIAGVIYSASIPAVARYTDEADYFKMSDHLLHGPGLSMDGVHLTACRPPGYIFFLAVIRAMGGDFFGIRVAQFLVLAATILLICRMGSEKKMFAGMLIVTGLVSCYPVLFYTSTTLYPQTVSAFLFILALTLNLVNPRGLPVNLATGIVFGALILEVPTFLFTLVTVQGAAWFLKIVRPRDVMLIVLAAALVVGSWTMRNAVVFHRFVPISSNSGMNFLMGNNENPAAMDAASNSAMMSYFVHAKELGLDEFEGDEYFKQAAWTWIGAHPGDALVLYLEKVLNFFNVVNGYSVEARGQVSTGKQVVMAASYIFLLALLGWRLFDTKRFPLIPREKLFLIVYVLSAFTSAIFFTRIRLRLPYDYLIIAIVAFHLSLRLRLWLAPSPARDRVPPCCS